MKIYIVTEGCYSDYHICAVFLSEDEAKIYCAAMHDADQDDEGFCIEEHDTDADHVEVAPGTKIHYEVFVNLSEDDTASKNLVIDDCDIDTHPTLKPQAPFAFIKSSRYDEGRYRAVLNTDDEDKIKKIFYDYLAQKKAEEAGL